MQHAPEGRGSEGDSRGMKRDLVEAASRGDHEAFEVLATSAAHRLYAVASLILRSSDLAQDAVQEALVHAWQRLPSLRDPDRFDAWLYRLVLNACADQGRQRRRWSDQVRPLVERYVSDDTGSVADREIATPLRNGGDAGGAGRRRAATNDHPRQDSVMATNDQLDDRISLWLE